MCDFLPVADSGGVAVESECASLVDDLGGGLDEGAGSWEAEGRLPDDDLDGEACDFTAACSVEALVKGGGS